MSAQAMMMDFLEFQKVCPILEFDKSVKTKNYKFQYVSLGHMIAETKPLLAKHNLTIIQLPSKSSNADFVAVKTLLVHASGELIEDVFEMKIPVSLDKNDEIKPITPQDIGSAISYARRYAYASILGLIADEDNDALPMADIYHDTAEDKNWLKAICEKIGITNIETVKDIHSKMIADKATKDEAVVKKYIV